MSAGITRRYVVPLFEVARSAGKLDKVADELTTLASTLATSEELRTFVATPTVDRRNKLSALNKIFTGFDPMTLNFIKTVVEKKRTDIFGLAGRIFVDLVNKEKGITTGVVESAFPLDAESFKQIEKAIDKRFGHKVQLDQRVNPDLLGGVRIQIGNQLIDSSVRGQLSKLRAELTGD